MFKRVVVVLVFLLSVMTIRAQVDVRDSTIAAFIPNFAYAAQIPVGDRWAIVAYVQALQRSQSAGVDDVPAELRSSLR